MKKWNKEERLALYRQAFAKWGPTAQVDMAVEEFAEAILAMQKLFKRDWSKTRFYDLASEFADVKIMMEEMEMLLNEQRPKGVDNVSFTDLVKEQMIFKLNRTEQRVNG